MIKKNTLIWYDEYLSINGKKEELTKRFLYKNEIYDCYEFKDADLLIKSATGNSWFEKVIRKIRGEK